MGDNTAIIVLLITIGIVWVVFWLWYSFESERKRQERLRQIDLEAKQTKRQEEERIEKLRLKLLEDIYSKLRESMEKTASKMGLAFDCNIKFVNDNWQLRFEIQDIESKPTEIQEKICNDFFKKSSNVFYRYGLKDLVETNPKYYNADFWFDESVPIPNQKNNPYVLKYYNQYFTNLHVFFSSYIKRKTFSKKQRDYVFKRDNYTCQVCGHFSPEGWFLEIDHIYPISKGGSNRPDNLQTLCETCNRRKGAKILET